MPGTDPSGLPDFLDNLIEATKLNKIDWVYDCSEIIYSDTVNYYTCVLPDLGELRIGISAGCNLFMNGGVCGGTEIFWRVSDLRSAIEKYLKRNDPVPYAKENEALRKLIAS